MSAITKIPGQSGKWEELYEVQSSSRPGVSYVVAKDDQGRWGCSCPRWIFHTPRQACKHILAVQIELAKSNLRTYTEAEVNTKPAIKKALSRFALIEV